MPRTKRPFGVLVAVLGVLIAAVAFAGPANAVNPYVDSAATSVSDQTPAAGSSFTVTGSGFQPGETVTVRLRGGATLGTTTADAGGNFSLRVTLPAGVTGTQTIVSTGETSGATSSITIQVGGVGTTAGDGTGSTSGGNNDDALANTGALVLGISTLALMLLVGGTLMLFAVRRRKDIA